MRVENNGGVAAGIVIQGQSTSSTIFQLDDNAVGFASVDSPQTFIDLNEPGPTNWQHAAFHTYVRNCTIDIGSGNPGAIGLDFCANNVGGLRQVHIRSSDPDYHGYTGLYLSTIPGPQLFKHVEITGFEWGLIQVQRLTIPRPPSF